MAKRMFLFGMILALCPWQSLPAAARPVVAVLPFGVAKSRSKLQWLGPAISSALTEKLRRAPSVRVLAITDVLRELDVAKIHPEKAAWAPAVTIQPLGRWLGATAVVVGAVGMSKDRAVAEQFLEVSISRDRTHKKAEIWLAARFVDTGSGQTLGQAYVEGRRSEVFGLQDSLLARLGDVLGLMPEAVKLEAIRRVATPSLEAYRLISEAEQILLQVRDMSDGKDRRKALRTAQKKVQKALGKDDRYAMAYACQGALLALMDIPTAAAAAYGQAAALDADFAAPRYGLAGLAYARGDLKATASALVSVVMATPWDAEANRMLGETHLALGDSGRALTAFEKSLDFFGEQPPALFEAGRLYLAQGRLEDAVRVLEKAVLLAPGEASYYAALTDAFIKAEQFSKAWDAFQTAEALGAVDADLLFRKGWLSLETGRTEDGIALLKQAVERAPERADIYAELGKAYLNQKRFAEAVAAFWDALARHAALPDFAVELGKAFEALGQPVDAETVYRQALEMAPGRVDIRLLLVKRLLVRKDPSGALAQLNRAAEIDPRNGSVHVLLGDLYAAQEKTDLAIRHYRRAFDLKTEISGTAVALGRLYLSRGETGRAAEICRAAVSAGVRHADLFAILGASEEIQGDRQAALTAYRQALELDSDHPEALSGAARMANALRPPPRQPGPEVYARRGRERVDAGDLQGAQVAFEQAVKLDPENAGHWNDLGTVYAKRGSLESAEAALKKAAELWPENPEGPYNLGRLYTDMHRAQQAQAAYREALKRDAGFGPAVSNLAAQYLAQGDASEAISVLGKALDRDAANPDHSLNLGNAYLVQRDFGEAEAAYTHAQDVAPRSAAARMGLGNVALARGDTAGAVAHYTHAATLNPEDPAPHVNLGSVSMAQGRLEEAIDNYQQAMGMAPQDPDIHLNLAVLYYKSQQYEEALGYCQTILERVPDFFRARLMVGIIAQAMGAYERAIEAYRLALQLQPDNPETVQGLASAYETLGDSEAALKHWGRWLDLVAGNPAYRQRIPDVKARIEALTKS